MSANDDWDSHEVYASLALGALGLSVGGSLLQKTRRSACGCRQRPGWEIVRRHWG